MPHSWNFSEWLDALGLRRRDQPDLIHGVQPVEIVGDHSAFTSQIHPPMAWVGGMRAGVAGTYSGFQFESRSPGGTYIRWLDLSLSTGSYMRHHLPAAPAAMANTIACATQEFGGGNTVSQFTLGTFAVAPATTAVPQAEISSSPGRSWQDFVYLSPGQTLECWISAVNLDLLVGLMFEDCPAQRSER